LHASGFGVVPDGPVHLTRSIHWRGNASVNEQMKAGVAGQASVPQMPRRQDRSIRS
jgi:hypothetical protein